MLTSIIESLRRILNSGCGDASTDGRYGLPDLRGLVRNMPQSAEGMREAIRQAVERYEPRLKRVRVRKLDDPESHRLYFEIVAELNDEEGGETPPLNSNTRLARPGRVHHPTSPLPPRGARPAGTGSGRTGTAACSPASIRRS